MAKKKRCKTKPPKIPASQSAVHFKLQSIRLMHSESKLALTKGEPPSCAGFSICCNANASHDDEKPRIDVDLEFTLESVDERQKTSTESSIKILGKYWLIYKSNSPSRLASDQLEAFIQSTSLPDAWPYWREYVQSMAMRMGLLSMFVPVSVQGQFSNSSSEDR